MHHKMSSAPWTVRGILPPVHLSVRHSLGYPFRSRESVVHFWVMFILAFVPFGETFLLFPYATTAVSVVTIERNESARLSGGAIATRFLRALVATCLTLVYLIPVVIGFAMIGYSLFTKGHITIPSLLLSGYALLVLCALPLATLHAVSTRNVFNALHLPKLVWLGLKMDWIAFIKLFALSLVLFGCKLGISLLSLFGFGLLMAPFKAYAEYVFQHMLAVAYARTVGA